MRSKEFEKAVFDRWGHACVVCSRTIEEMLESGATQDKLPFHHVNGDDDDDRAENVIPVCQSCHVHIHKVDEPPYRVWHRQLPIEHRNAWNAHYQEYYEGPRLTRQEAEERFGDDDGIPESIIYLKREREDFDPSRFTSAEEGEPRESTNAESEESTVDNDDTIADDANKRGEPADDDDVDTAGDATDPDTDTGGESDS